MVFLKREVLNAGVVEPLIVNDNMQRGSWAYGTGLGCADLLSHRCLSQALRLCSALFMVRASQRPPVLPIDLINVEEC